MKSALISVITTAGFDLKSPCYALYEYCVKVLKGIAHNDSQFIYIAQMDETDDMWTPKNWIKANPILQYDLEALENMIPIAETAKEMGGSSLRDFIVKQLNMWIQWTNDVYLKDMELWQNGATKKTLEDFRGQKCYVGLDLSAGGDLTSLAIVFPFLKDDVRKYFVHAHSFIPKRRVEEHIKTDRTEYDLWIRDGLVTVTETMGGVKTDYRYILTYLEKIITDYELDVQFILYDPHNASAFLTDLEALGFDSVAVTQSAKALNDATVDFRLEIESGNVEHDGNAMIKWSIANAKTTSNSFGEIKIDKEYQTCLKMMSETLAKIPWKYYQKTEKGIIEPELSDVAKLLKNRPNPFMTPTAFWNAVEMNRNHFGNAYVYVRSKFKRKKYGGEYKVMDLWIMPSNCVQIVVDDEGYFGGRGKIWYVYNDKYSGQQYVFGTDEVLHFKTSHSLDGITGLPVQAILKTTVEGAAASQDYLNSLYESGLTGKATLEYTGDLNKDLKEKLVQAFEEFGSGAKNAGKIIPVPLGMKLTPLDIKLSDSQFIELKKYSALQIAAAFGIKPNQINDYTKSSYSNSEMQQLSFLTDTMLFVLKQYEEEVNYKLLTDEEAFSEGKYYKLNEKVLLRTDSKTQMEIFATGVQNGIQKVNECRRKLDLMDAEGGDQLIVNGNYIPITEVGKQYEKAGNAQQQSVLPIQPETDQKTQKDPEEGDQADTTGTEPDEKESQEGGENDEE